MRPTTPEANAVAIPAVVQFGHGRHTSIHKAGNEFLLGLEHGFLDGRRLL